MANEEQPGGREYAEGNTDENGDYIVGKNRTPVATRFAVGDGRKRGRRRKGQRNFDTELLEELGRLVTLREGGKERRVTKLRSTIIRFVDNAAGRGQNPAIALLVNNLIRIADKNAEQPDQQLGREDQKLIDDWLLRRMIELGTAAADEGDPDELPTDAEPMNGREGVGASDGNSNDADEGSGHE